MPPGKRFNKLTSLVLYDCYGYRRNRFNRRMDTWLASKVRYLVNRKNELDLRAMGERNEALQAERETFIRTLSETVDAQLLQARVTLSARTPR